MPWVRHMEIEPHLALALFIAPAVMDSALELPPRVLLRLWVPLTALAVWLTLLTTAIVAWAAHSLAGLPIAAAIAFGPLNPGKILRTEFHRPTRAKHAQCAGIFNLLFLCRRG